jgi:hypothetical protein
VVVAVLEVPVAPARIQWAVVLQQVLLPVGVEEVVYFLVPAVLGRILPLHLEVELVELDLPWTVQASLVAQACIGPVGREVVLTTQVARVTYSFVEAVQGVGVVGVLLVAPAEVVFFKLVVVVEKLWQKMAMQLPGLEDAPLEFMEQ